MTNPRTRKDFISDQQVKWCPGCGDYAILAQSQTVFAELDVPRENFVVVSGIGCSSRFPYYVNTYGFHTIHGRAPTIASGVKLARPELSVWVVTGDGDALSIGGNHTAHLIRRNLDVNVLLFNNRIYGLTKGQASPTSEVGKKTKSTPFGTVERPFNPMAFALGCEATFVARTVDVFSQQLRDVLRAGHAHAGTSFVEVYQTCEIFNDGAFGALTDRGTRDDHVLMLQHGAPMTFAGGKKGIRLVGHKPVVVDLGERWSASDCLVHDETDVVLAGILARMEAPGFPIPMGILHREAHPTYDALAHEQIARVEAKAGHPSVDSLLEGRDTWDVA
ncbi:MAG: 2-oxoacid:ferredoxin oxidoreductase subunit beta [Myxococcota bacterium]